MRELSASAVAAILSWAPERKTAEWSQQAMADVLTHWSRVRQTDVRQLANHPDIDQIGWQITYRVGDSGESIPHSLEGTAEADSVASVVAEFQVDWLAEVENVVRDEVADSEFEPVEFVLFVADRAGGSLDKAADVVNLPVRTAEWVLLRVEHLVRQDDATMFTEMEFQPSDATETYSTTVADVLAAREEDLPIGEVTTQEKSFLP